MRPKVLDLFSGIGGFALAFEAAGFETAAFSEIEPYPCKVLAQHWPEVPNLGDVRGINGEDYRGTVDVICGGFPCQDISTAGKGAGLEGARSGLWFEMLRVIRGARPAFCLIENVPALRTRGADRVLADLEESGYTGRAFVVGAVHAGAPHRRQRVWIVAYSRSPAGRIQPIHQRLPEAANPCWHGEAQPLADPNHPGQPADWREGQAGDHAGRSGSDVADALRAGLFPSPQAGVYRSEEGPRARHEHVKRCGWWTTEPGFCRVVNGIPFELDLLGGLNGARGVVAEAKDADPKSKNAFAEWAMLRAMWEHRAIAAASPELYERKLRDCLPEMPRQNSPGRWLLGTWIEKSKGLCDLWEAFYSKPFDEAQDLQQRLLKRIGAIKRTQEVGPTKNQAHRIKALGNSIVPAVAYPFAQFIYAQLLAEGPALPETSSPLPLYSKESPK